MDRTRLPVPDGMRALEGRPWVEFKNRLRAHMVVPVNLDTMRCIACTHPVTESEGGRLEHLRTGLCEQCWDILNFGPSLERTTLAAERCDRLKEDPSAHEFVSHAVGRCGKDKGRWKSHLLREPREVHDPGRAWTRDPAEHMATGNATATLMLD